MKKDFDSTLWRKRRLSLDKLDQEFSLPLKNEKNIFYTFFSVLKEILISKHTKKGFGLWCVCILPFILLLFLAQLWPIVGLFFILMLPMAWAYFALGVKRMRDIGSNGVWFFVVFLVGFGLPLRFYCFS